jgi:hypothetical protein
MGAHWLPLTGADCFLRAFDAEIRRLSAASHVSQAVLRLAPGFDPAALAKRIAELADKQPIVRAPIRRRGLVGAPAYALHAARESALPRLEIRDFASGDPSGVPPAPLVARLNEPISLQRGELLRFDVARYAGGAQGCDVVATWAHLLFDGAGSERFLVWLDECFRGLRSASELPDPGEFDPPPPPALGAGERGRRAREWQQWMASKAAVPLRSLAGPARRVRQDLRYELLALTPEESERATQRAAALAGFLTPMPFYLAVAIRAHHVVFRARGADPGAYLVPLPVDLRAKGREGAIFRTRVSLLWFYVQPALAADLPALLDELKLQRRDAIRSGQIENGAFAMEFARPAPSRLYSYLARRDLRGELCSFFFAYTGEFGDGTFESFFGARVENAYHVAPVPASPGSCLAFSLFRGHLNANHVYQSDAISRDERALFARQLRADLLGESPLLA